MSAWHSIAPGVSKVYHNNKKCATGDNINPKYKRSGMGSNRRLCKECKRLNR